jgi:hypothetical protein
MIAAFSLGALRCFVPRGVVKCDIKRHQNLPEEKWEGVLNRGVPVPRVQLRESSQHNLRIVDRFIQRIFNGRQIP